MVNTKQKDEIEFAAFMGIDWADQTHAWALELATHCGVEHGEESASVVKPPVTSATTLKTNGIPAKIASSGLVSYQGDIDTDKYGRGVGDFTGIFSKETFI